MSDKLAQMLKTRDWILADGATGTNLFALGLEHGDAPERWNLEETDKVKAHYRSFIDAGSDLVLTNTFGGTANRLKLHDMQDKVHEINAAAARLLAEAIAESGRDVICAGDVGPTGDLFAPVGPLTHADGVAAFTAQMQGLKDGGADLVWIETMSSEEEYNAALEAAAAVGMPCVGTMSFDTNGRTMMGVTPTRLAGIVHACGHDHAPIAWGGNCGTGASDLLVGVISAADAITEHDVIVTKANCGIPEYHEGAIRYTGTTELMADYACIARDLGVKIIGGCCGTTPNHIAAMREALESTPRGPKPGVDEILARLGPVTGTTMELLSGASAAPARRPGRRRRGAA
ncbi:5-methyltetrahydrofolate--homocysteine methyltransferase [Albimonas donghaensis]|uniref:5-methyltetrahydrofolate--homocysteine methyltransferase n=1 Tax=Albimonas donghaensis TaxID=356660 RepID=A0A1H3B1Q6_9RHOB|nr:betaine--homocysteine S-methyltransferase [Albimonas donghaensis]SDX35324.1 5-methyltetrahydrofolate--homocysteine methyltransferase [Albimonas donghaensis]